MGGFELEIHNWNGERTGTVRIKDPHSGVTRVIVHVYDTYVEIIEDGKGGPFATHFLGTKPEDDHEDYIREIREQMVEEFPSLPNEDDDVKDCCGGEPRTNSKCNNCGCVEAGNASYTCGRHQKWTMRGFRDVEDCCDGSPEVGIRCGDCGCRDDGQSGFFTCPRHTRDPRGSMEYCCAGEPVLNTTCKICGCQNYVDRPSMYGIGDGNFHCERHQGWDGSPK